MSGIKRNLEYKARKMLGMFPVVAILGARQVGKTTLAKKLSSNWKYIDLEDPDDFDLISRNPKLFFKHYPKNVIIDEAQTYPELFQILRSVVDRDRSNKGRFIITGSSSPELLSHISETLAGRIGLIELGTLKANEYYRKPLSPFYELFSEKLSPKRIISGPTPLTVTELEKLWLKGGYPEPLLEGDPLFYSQWMENYRNTYINRDIARLFPRLNKIAYQRFLTILSKLSGTIINKRDLARSIEVNEGTIREYINIAEGTFLWRSLPSFDRNVVKSIIKMPKGYIRDTGLLHYLTRIGSFEELLEDPLIGISFEAFVMEELLKGLEATLVTNWNAYYYRTRNGAEIDLLLDGPFGLLPIEIKYGTSVKLKQLTALSQFIEEHKLPLGIVINQSDSIEWVTSKIVQIPVGWI
ncbi:MAG: ATP-binding protein [Alphaproteobacteria bacterium]|nr:ATP-binding protein [Alphaproteobacteria bacterium]